MQRTLIPCLIVILAFPVAVVSQTEPTNGAAKQATVGGQRVLLPDKLEGVKAGWLVIGKGQTKEEAVKDAYDRARYVVEAFVKQQDNSMAWMPTVSYIKKRLRGKDGSKRQEDFDSKIKVGKYTYEQVAYSVPISITEGDWRDIQRQERNYRRALRRQVLDQRAEMRLFVVAKVVAFILAGCVLVVVYLRLEEKTKGYLTRWLGLGLLVLILGVALSLYFCC